MSDKHFVNLNVFVACYILWSHVGSTCEEQLHLSSEHVSNYMSNVNLFADNIKKCAK